MQANNFWAVLALVLIIEGLLPFLSPKAFKDYLRTMLEFEDTTIRRIGMLMLMSGAAVFFLINS
ncbi:MAG: DUF2065 domain-containing protein [Gammaproteobacteria bacterium]|nr:DUF2065 domain-containing protein [Gammaproteobacteria bacterium]NNC98292.1 DUF2065 domain-containing protein [Gammaproteobacteria bacterium]NNM13606.1 DUF2065 domain-containing protein [Gammaproteobacteria bacterium]